jgi:hypothetical protein
MPDFAYYQVYLQAGNQEVETYLLSNELFWPLNASPAFGEPGYPKFTLGGFLYYEACARAMAQSASQMAAMRKIEMDMNSSRTRWQVAWLRKASWELNSRLQQWGNVLQEIRLDPEEHRDYYRYEVRVRVLISLLLADIKEIEPAQQERIDGLDILLRAFFHPGDFVWEPELADGFPRDPFWYLWGNPK